MLTTKRLLQYAIGANVFHADSTYKMNWMGFPVHVFGVTDHHRAFHFVAIGFSTKETQKEYSFCFKTIKEAILEILQIEISFKAFMSNAAPALKKAFAEHFPYALQLVCWFHVKKAIKMRSFKEQTNPDLLLKDITQLHLCASLESFNIASKLFVAKWNRKEGTVITYIKKQWLDAYYKYWFAGAIDLAQVQTMRWKAQTVESKMILTFGLAPK